MAEVSLDRVGEDGLDEIEYVVLDTGCINKDYRLSADETAFLLEHARSRNLKVCVTDIVVLEMVNHFREDLQAANDSLGKALRLLDRLVAQTPGENLSEAALEAAVTDYEATFRELLTANGVLVAPVPSALTGVQPLLERDLRRRKPFGDRRGAPKDRSGMRDALLWESVLELCRRDPRAVVLISTNTDDFADNSKTRLHQHLLDDLQGVGIEPLKVSFFPSIQAFNDARLRTRAPDAGLPDQNGGSAS